MQIAPNSYNVSKEKPTSHNQKYPQKCCRCGMCCLVETCPVGMKIYDIDKYKLCPGLYFEGNKAICGLSKYFIEQARIDKKVVEEVMGFNVGCCIKARVYKDGIEYNFADLDPDIKISIAQRTKAKNYIE